MGLLVVALAPLPGAAARADRLVGDVPEYREIQQRLATGWNTWNSRSVLAHVLLPEGFIPNDNRGNGSKSFDRSQPPVGSIMVREIAKRFPQRWFVEATFDPLWEWNRWWLRRRLNEGLLSYGSHAAKNPFHEPATRSKRTAGYESGMDDSPRYEGVPFNQEKNTLELQDVGLTSLWIADFEALARARRSHRSGRGGGRATASTPGARCSVSWRWWRLGRCRLRPLGPGDEPARIARLIPGGR